MMRERFDRIEIIDLRGDVRRGPRAGIAHDVGVFDIQVGTAITLAIADGSRAGQLAEVRYLDCWAEGIYTRSAKLAWLARGAGDGALPNAVPVVREPLADFRPRPFANGQWPSLRECFEFGHSGIESKRDSLVYGPSDAALTNCLQEFLAAPVAVAREMFHEVGARTATAAQAIPLEPQLIHQVAYRPLDRRFHYNHNAYNDRLRPDLQRVWGRHNVSLYSLPSGTGAGPAVWCHGHLPDRHAFRGSYGGYAFPLHDRRPEVAGTNIARPLIDGLAAAYGLEVAPEQVFDAILCLLSAQSYTLRFAEDLEDVFPHVPFPADHDVFAQLAALGALIRAAQTFDAAHAPSAAADPAFVRLATAPTRGAVLHVVSAGHSLSLCADGSGRVEGLPPALWAFEVSGYPVLHRWLEGRAGLPVDLELFDTFRDVCARLADLVRLFDQADTLLASTLTATLNRDALGLTNA